MNNEKTAEKRIAELEAENTHLKQAISEAAALLAPGENPTPTFGIGDTPAEALAFAREATGSPAPIDAMLRESDSHEQSHISAHDLLNTPNLDQILTVHWHSQSRTQELARYEVDKLKSYLMDIENATQFAIDEKCDASDRHCGCVPLLRVKLAAIEDGGWQRYMEEFISDGSCPLCKASDETGHTRECPWGRDEIRVRELEEQLTKRPATPPAATMPAKPPMPEEVKVFLQHDYSDWTGGSLWIVNAIRRLARDVYQEKTK